MIDLDKLEALAKTAITSGLPGDRMMFALHAMDPEGILALIAEARALRKDAERWRTEMILRNHPAVAIMFVGTENSCSIYRNGELIASGETYAEAIDAARAKEQA